MVKRLLLSILLFFLFYTPPVFGLNCLRLIALFSLCYIFFNFHYVFRNIKSVQLIKQYIIWTGIILYIALIGNFNGNTLNGLAGQIYWLISIVPTCVVLLCITKKNGMDIKDIIDCALIAGLIQSLLAISAFISPSIKEAMVTSLNNANMFMEKAYDNEFFMFRMFGYSAGLTFGMPVLQAFLAMLALFMSINYKIKYAICFPFIAFSAIINARTSFVVFGLCGLVMLVEKNRHGLVTFLKFIGLVLTVFCLVFIAIPIWEEYLPSSFNWVSMGFSELLFLLEGKAEGWYFSYLFSPQRWIFPEGLEVLFGVGARVLGNNKYGSASDIGYVNDVWFGGILYTFFIYCLFFSYCKKLQRLESFSEQTVAGLGKYLSHAFLINAVFLNLKTYVIDINNLSTFFILILVFADLLLIRTCKDSTQQ